MHQPNICDSAARDPSEPFPHGSPAPSEGKDASAEQTYKMEAHVSLASVMFKSSQSNLTRKQLTGEKELRAMPTCAAGMVLGRRLSRSPGPA